MRMHLKLRIFFLDSALCLIASFIHFFGILSHSEGCKIYEIVSYLCNFYTVPFVHFLDWKALQASFKHSLSCKRKLPIHFSLQERTKENAISFRMGSTEQTKEMVLLGET